MLMIILLNSLKVSEDRQNVNLTQSSATGQKSESLHFVISAHTESNAILSDDFLMLLVTNVWHI